MWIANKKSSLEARKSAGESRAKICGKEYRGSKNEAKNRANGGARIWMPHGATEGRTFHQDGTSASHASDVWQLS